MSQVSVGAQATLASIAGGRLILDSFCQITTDLHFDAALMSRIFFIFASLNGSHEWTLEPKYFGRPTNRLANMAAFFLMGI